MEDKLKSILIAHGMYGVENLNEATQQILLLFDVVGKTKHFYCQTEHEVGGGRCDECCNPEGECFFKKK